MPRKKRDELEEDNFLDEVDGEIEDEVDDEGDQEVAEKETSKEEVESDEKKDGAPEVAAEEEAVEEVEVEEEIDYPPDDKKAVAALEKLKVRLDVSDKGNVWRVIFDDSNGRDPALVLLNGLPALRELWLLGTRITAEATEEFKEEHPKITVYH